MINLQLPSWFDRGEARRLKQAVQLYWAQVEQWIKWPYSQADAETCVLAVLDLLAWERDIDRFDGEPEWLYRKRVKYAKVNAEDAGSVAGIKRIFERLGVGYVEVVERDPVKPWDVITLILSDSQLAQNNTLLQVMVDMYGRTCRRYEFETITNLKVEMREIELFANFNYDQAKR